MPSSTFTCWQQLRLVHTFCVAQLTHVVPHVSTYCVVRVQVTLHNVALINMDTDPSGGFQRFGHLIANAPFPPETFGNLLLL